MSESPSEPVALPAPPATSPRPSRAPWLLLPVLLLVVAIASYWSWQQLQARREAERGAAEWQLAAEALQTRVGELDRELDGVRERQKQIESRIGEAAAGTRVLRDEVLGIAERAALVEDAVARLAEQRERGDTTLRLNEVDYVLQLGEERLRLFGDSNSAASAFAIADGALAGIDDAALAALRQTLAIELAALRAAAVDPRPNLRQRIAGVLGSLDRLPARDAPAPVSEESQPRLLQLLDRLVTVRRISDSQLALTPIERASRVAALRLQLGLALAALESRQGDAWQAALDSALGLFDGLYASDAAAVVARQTLIDARASALVQPVPDVGTTLRELRALRASRSLGSSQPEARPGSRSGATSPPASLEAVEAEADTP